MVLPFSRVSAPILKILIKQLVNRKLPVLLPEITPLGKRYNPHRRWPSARFQFLVSSFQFPQLPFPHGSPVNGTLDRLYECAKNRRFGAGFCR